MTIFKKILLKITFISLILINSPSILPSPNLIKPNLQETQKEDSSLNLSEKMGNFILHTAIPIGIILFYFYVLTENNVKETFAEQLSFQNLAQNFAKEYFCSLITTIAHEFSHSLCAKILIQNSININLGGSIKNSTCLRSKYLNIKGLDPQKGSCSLNFKKGFAQEHKIKYAAIYLSGGIGGALTAILLNLIINYFEKKPNNANDSKTLLLSPLVIEHLLNALLPISKKSDATKIWINCFNASDQTIKIATQIQFYLYLLAEICITCRQKQCNDAQFLDKLFITLLNLYTKGFLRFHI